MDKEKSQSPNSVTFHELINRFQIHIICNVAFCHITNVLKETIRSDHGKITFTKAGGGWVFELRGLYM